MSEKKTARKRGADIVPTAVRPKRAKAETKKTRKKQALNDDDDENDTATATAKAVPAKKRCVNNDHPDMHVVYLLQCVRPDKNNKVLTYVGSTNNFTRRLRQHNGEISGGAWSTKIRSCNHRYPWKPICLVRGFPLMSYARGFEKRVKHILLSAGKGTPAGNARTTERGGNALHRRVRQFLIMCGLERWTKKCPLAAETPVVFEWHDAQYKPLVTAGKGPYLPEYVTETSIPPPIA